MDELLIPNMNKICPTTQATARHVSIHTDMQLAFQTPLFHILRRLKMCKSIKVLRLISSQILSHINDKVQGNARNIGKTKLMSNTQ
jgi:hypothetical protein